MGTGLNNRNNWIFGKCDSIVDDKQALKRSNILQMLNKTTQMFRYSELPETIDYKDLETQLQVNGFAVFKQVDGKLYSFTGGLGGEPNPYYLPTKAIIANPALKYNASLEIGEECVVMLNDHYYQGLMPLFNKYATLLTESEISLKYALLNARIPALIQADNDGAFESAEEFIKKIYDGKDYGIIANKEFFEGIKTYDFYKQAHIKDLIESTQFIKAQWYSELGLNSLMNMKREAINEAESTMNDDVLFPFVDTMLECRRKALEKVNEMYGTNITVDFNSSWAVKQMQQDLGLELEQAEIENLENVGEGENGDTDNVPTQEETT